MQNIGRLVTADHDPQREFMDMLAAEIPCRDSDVQTELLAVELETFMQSIDGDRRANSIRIKAADIVRESRSPGRS